MHHEPIYRPDETSPRSRRRLRHNKPKDTPPDCSAQNNGTVRSHNAAARLPTTHATTNTAGVPKVSKKMKTAQSITVPNQHEDIGIATPRRRSRCAPSNSPSFRRALSRAKPAKNAPDDPLDAPPRRAHRRTTARQVEAVAQVRSFAEGWRRTIRRSVAGEEPVTPQQHHAQHDPMQFDSRCIAEVEAATAARMTSGGRVGRHGGPDGRGDRGVRREPQVAHDRIRHERVRATAIRGAAPPTKPNRSRTRDIPSTSGRRNVRTVKPSPVAGPGEGTEIEFEPGKEHQVEQPDLAELLHDAVSAPTMPRTLGTMMSAASGPISPGIRTRSASTARAR